MIAHLEALFLAGLDLVGHLICYFLMKRTEFLIVWPSVSPPSDYLFCLYV